MRNATLLDIGGSTRGTFLRRVNRFLAEVQVGKKVHLTLLRNTGRLGELQPGTEVLCTQRRAGKTSLLILAFVSRGVTILIDPALQSRAFEIAAGMGLLPWLHGWHISRGEVKVGDSRIDYLIENRSSTGYLETKSAARLGDTCATYPDCPTDRGVRHIRLLGQLARRGHRCVILFVATHPDAECFRPDRTSDPRVAEGLLEARASGAEVRSIKLVLEQGSVQLVDPSLKVLIPRATLRAD